MTLGHTTISCRPLARITVGLIVSLTLAAAQETAQKKPYETRWSVALPAPPMFPPVVAGNHVYVAHLPGVVAAYAASDGRLVWQADVSPVQPPIVDGEMVVVVSKDAVQAVGVADGGHRWSASALAIVTPIVARNGWLVGASANGLHALRARDGSQVWFREVANVREAAAISGDVVFVSSIDGLVRAFDLIAGEPLWQRRVGGAPNEPLVVGDRVYFGSTDKHFYCLDADTGEKDWQMRVGATLYARASTDGQRVIFGALDNLVRAVDRTHGALRWQQGVPFRPLAPPLVAGDLVLVAGTATDIRVFRSTDGTQLPSVTFPEKLGLAPALSSSPAELLVVGATGSLSEGWTLTTMARSADVPGKPADRAGH